MKIKSQGYSATVRMRLMLGDERISVSQMASDFIIVHDPKIERPPGSGTLHLSVDGKDEQWAVSLPGGIHPDRTRTLIAR